MEKRIFLASPTMHGEEQQFIQEAFDTNWVAPLGKNVNEFEKELAAFVGEGHAAALTAGTAALHLAVKLAGVQRGDKVFCSDLTFSATVNPVSYEGGEQIFIEASGKPGTWTPGRWKPRLPSIRIASASFAPTCTVRRQDWMRSVPSVTLMGPC